LFISNRANLEWLTVYAREQATGTLLLGLAAALGSISSQHLWMALLFAAVMAIVAGGLRHLSADYGPPLAAPTVFIFLMASASPPGHGEVLSQMLSTWGGGALGIVLQMALWPFRSQQPLRRIAAECWQEAANLVGIFNDDSGQMRLSRTTQSPRSRRGFVRCLTEHSSR
jgi:hypothetical protein